METFGDKLRSEREHRGLSIEAVSPMIGIDQEQLQALERNEFDKLPGPEAMINCLRAYARCLEVDAELMIEDYVREREECLRHVEKAVTDSALPVAPTATPHVAERRSGFPRLLVVVLFAVVALGAWWMFSGSGSASRPEPLAAPVAVEAQPTPPEIRVDVARTPSVQPVQPMQPVQPAQPAQPVQPAEPATPTISHTSTLSIPDHDVGTGVENRQLVGEGDHFDEGTQVWFWTRVEGGQAGDSIDHVWLHNGVEAFRMPLKIGGARWRTQSAKTLHAGSAGNWAVEARDADSRVLARHEFVCVQ